MIPSQPSHWASSLPVHNDGSPAHNLLTLPSPRHSDNDLFTAAAEIVGKGVGQTIDASLSGLVALSVDRFEQLVERGRKQLDALSQQCVGHVLHGDAGFGKRGHRVARGIDIFHEARAWAAVIAKRIHRGRGHRVDRVVPNQVFDIEHVAIARVLRPGAGPQQSLRLRPFALSACHRNR
jgi:hypothetical protein